MATQLSFFFNQIQRLYWTSPAQLQGLCFCSTLLIPLDKLVSFHTLVSLHFVYNRSWYSFKYNVLHSPKQLNGLNTHFAYQKCENFAQFMDIVKETIKLIVIGLHKRHKARYAPHWSFNITYFISDTYLYPDQRHWFCTLSEPCSLPAS